MSEMTSFSAAHPQSSPPPSSCVVTLWDRFVDAAEAKYGASIDIIDTKAARNKLFNLDFDISIVSSDPSPTEVRRAVVDITTKEFINHCEKEVDESLVKVGKSTFGWTGSRYHFSTIGGGVSIGGEIGPKVIHLAIAGGSTNIHACKQNLVTLEEEHKFDYGYSHEEKILVPPKSHVKARITSYSVNYQQGFTILFSIPASVMIPVSYRTRCLCFSCLNMGYVSVAEVFSTLPNYRNESGTVSFIQRGTLSWIGEGSGIEKIVETLQIDCGALKC